MKPLIKRELQNLAMIVLILVAIKNIYIALPIKGYVRLHNLIHGIHSPIPIQHHGILPVLSGILMLLLAYRLYKRVRLAWLIEVIALVVSITYHLARHQIVPIHSVLLDVFVLLILLTSYKDFSRSSDRITVKKSIGFIFCSFFLVLTNAAIGLFLLKGDIRSIHTIYDAIYSSVKLLVLMDTSSLGMKGAAGKFYSNTLITINWICIMTSAFLLLKPLVYNPIVAKHGRHRARQLTLKYGDNPMAYLALENDKKYFFSSRIEGFCAYRLAGNVFTVCGDMICDEKDGFMFLWEITDFCTKNGYNILFINITDKFTSMLNMAGFGIIKYGEDACFLLKDYNLAGGKVAKIRTAINHANKEGITVLEYKPLEKKDHFLEKQMHSITEEWLIKKGGVEMGFMLGGMGLKDPMDRRYFYALSKEGEMLGFVVFLPYLEGKAYLADVTRRRSTAPQGVLEKIIYDAFMKMKEEGVIWGNMGLSPLYNISKEENCRFTEKVFTFIYENMNNTYDFQALHHAKLKFGPTDWQPRYLAFSPNLFSLNFGYAILKVQMPKNLFKTILPNLLKLDRK
ncbi:DUF2156 domain-containing protein [Aminipila butyrica]|uniref:DUF2156 domain-containing protein n=1 Tax=Aminipila butyrica TaxID=433296 RepID=A0A858BZJ5_9FIRM|nr:phosphatidylglycerol lysyltransferase domain-containing protein [Aminipila butyrica]QIB69516.1 DUF2156 domain-containing protein [Aminipila butyrica]